MTPKTDILYWVVALTILSLSSWVLFGNNFPYKPFTNTIHDTIYVEKCIEDTVKLNPTTFIIKSLNFDTIDIRIDTMYIMRKPRVSYF